MLHDTHFAKWKMTMWVRGNELIMITLKFTKFNKMTTDHHALHILKYVDTLLNYICLLFFVDVRFDEKKTRFLIKYAQCTWCAHKFHVLNCLNLLISHNEIVITRNSKWTWQISVQWTVINKLRSVQSIIN